MDELKRFLYVNNLRQKDLADFLGLTEASVSRFVHGVVSLPERHLHNLINNDKGWDASMFTERSTTVNATAKDHSQASVTINSNNSVGSGRNDERKSSMTEIPIIPLDAHAGSLGDYSSSVMAYQCEMMVSPIAGATCAIRISGDSMAPSYGNGDIAILKRINERAFVEYGKVYCLDTCNGAIIKEVRKAQDPDVIECHSLNPDPKYQPFEIRTEYINGWYRVLMVMSLK